MQVLALESSIERVVVSWAENHNILHTKLALRGRRGSPDHIFWIPGGRPALIEFKRLGKKPRRLQLYVIGLLKELGYNVFATDNKEDAIKFLENCISEAPRVPKTRS